MGEERLVPYRDPRNRYQLSFVSTWQVGAGPAPYEVSSRQGDRTIGVSIVSPAGTAALALAQADAARLQTSVSGYKQLALRTTSIPYGPVATLIYQHDKGKNPVTGKGKPFISARIYVPRKGSSTDVAVIEVTAPAPFYGDLTQIFDPVVASFRWR